MLNYFYRLSTQRTAWILLFLSAMAFEACALFFQYVMKLDPCVMCIYERVAMMGVMVAALIGLLVPSSRVLRWPAILLWLYAAAKGLQLSVEHVGYQFPDPNELFGPTCDIFTSFPTWAPLDQWFPWFFEASGECSKIVWQFLTLSMPQWLVVIFAGMLLMAIVVAASQVFSSKTKH